MLSDDEVCLHGVCAKRSWAKLHSVKLDIQEVLRKNEVNRAGRRATMKEEKNPSWQVTTLEMGKVDKTMWTRLQVRHQSDRILVTNQPHGITPFEWSYAQERFVQHSCLCRFHSIPVVIVPRFRTATVLQIKIKGENCFTFQRTVTWIP